MTLDTSPRGSLRRVKWLSLACLGGTAAGAAALDPGLVIPVLAGGGLAWLSLREIEARMGVVLFAGRTTGRGVARTLTASVGKLGLIGVTLAGAALLRPAWLIPLAVGLSCTVMAVAGEALILLCKYGDLEHEVHPHPRA